MTHITTSFRGADEEGNDLTNPLSFLVLDAAHWLNSSANLTVRMHDAIDPAFLRKAVTYLFTDRNGWPRFSGAKGLMNYMRNPGVTHADAARRIAVGCNWMAVPGVEYPINDCVKINVARIFRLSLDEMMEAEAAPSLENLIERLQVHLTRAVEVAARGVCLHLEKQQYVMPELVMNLMMENTLELGQDISVCARLKTIGVDGVGLGTVADSLAALEQRIVLEKRVTFAGVYEGLQSDYAGKQGERLRLMLKSSQRYCGGGTLGDRWAGVVSRMYSDTVVKQPMPEGVSLVPGWFSWSSTIHFGKMVGATPDGRHAGKPVTHGANPNPGFRRDGAVTAMASGIAAIQTGYGNTCPLQLEFDPGLSAEEGGIERVEQILKTHVRDGGYLNQHQRAGQGKADESPRGSDALPRSGGAGHWLHGIFRHPVAGVSTVGGRSVHIRGGGMTMRRLISWAAALTVLAAGGFAWADEGAAQMDIPYMKDWPTLPTPFQTRNWAETATDAILLMLDEAAELPYFPATVYSAVGTPSAGGYTGESFETLSYLHPKSGSGEAVTQLAAVLTMGLIDGVDPRSLNGRDYVRMAQAYYSETPDGRGFISNNLWTDDCTDSYWYTLYPTLLYFHLAALYPQDETFARQMRAVADTWLEALDYIGTWNSQGGIPEKPGGCRGRPHGAGGRIRGRVRDACGIRALWRRRLSGCRLAPDAGSGEPRGQPLL